MARRTRAMKAADSNGASGAGPQRRVTINEVARCAGVSKTSVSRYLGGELSALSEDMRRQIERAIAELDYRPNQMARGLKRGRSRLVGMVVADILNPYSVAVMHGVEVACRQRGYALMLCNTAGDDELERRHLAALASYSVEGLIVHTTSQHTRDLLDAAAHGLPVVAVDREISGLAADMVGIDNRQAASVATEHLIAQGYRDLLYLSEPLDHVNPRIERLAAFEAVLAQHPACRGRALALDVHASARLDQALGDFLAATGPGPRAVFAANGVVTLETTRALRRLGCRLFEDTGLIGFDELEWCALVGSGITTVAQPTYDIGVTAAQCLMRRIEGDRSAPRQTLYRGELIVRGSTQPIAR